MKSLKRILLFCTILGLTLGLVGCASMPQSDAGAKQYLNNSSMTKRVEKKLAAGLGKDNLKAVKISSYQGVVQLSGVLNSQADVNKAVKLAKSVKGVKEVANSLLIKTSLNAKPYAKSN